eukprot:CAMPEP_0116943920 /NCGR_PEP_ID=MMETSP0467-20121206/35480_1 /TAXON_ID=283647 /ORGANISM="Mesodinium pulex, Strain SPMC105" /LENGTH=88 /DNA_ID=CAMNT_0004627205 /DNA_START=253 /DNA_END=520 /DNA_ORIENTATION=-
MGSDTDTGNWKTLNLSKDDFEALAIGVFRTEFETILRENFSVDDTWFDKNNSKIPTDQLADVDIKNKSDLCPSVIIPNIVDTKCKSAL